MCNIYDIYNVKVTILNKNGNKEEKIEKIKAKNDLQAMDKVNRYYKNTLKRKILDLEII